jgi:hypothetical protein
MPATRSRRTYEIRHTFRAPLAYVFGWCTDYTTRDAQYAKERYTRRILKRGPTAVVYEDLYDRPDGWMWSHQQVALHPPNRWRAVATGSHRSWSIDYRLRRLPGDRTELHFKGRRWPTAISVNPPKAELERELRTLWRNLGSALERDYRAARPARTPARRTLRR